MNDNRKITWYHMAPTRTVFAIALFFIAVGIILLIRLDQLNFMRAYQTAAVTIVSVFACIGFLGANHGGSTLDVSTRQLIRWRGPFVPIWTQRIAFDAIQQINIGPGFRPGSIQAARKYDYSYHVAIVTDQGPIVVRLTKSQNDARHYAGLIAEAVGCPSRESGE